MNLKLATYNPEGKFEGFKELGKDFVFGGDHILLFEPGLHLLDSVEKFKLGKTCPICAFPLYQFFQRDEKDPLNRFPDKDGKGLFDGRSFGAGRFILVIDDCDDVEEVIDVTISIKDSSGKETKREACGLYMKNQICWDFEDKENFGKDWYSKYERNVVGNLHENPELFDKISKL